MDNERWLQAKKLFDKAIELDAAARARFFEDACRDDAELRREVEELIASYDSAFLEEGAVADAVGLSDRAFFQQGQAIGRYRLREPIGEGGMGQVFLADDTELDRPVAFKFLHADVAEDDERVRRFIQEAKAASALNHPNILTIYEVGSFEGCRFIVSEYIDGHTLRDRMRQGLSVQDTIDITCQMAAALQAAHAAGIVHRDVKPENVMIRRDGLVKVLDFGLAKLTEADDKPIDANAVPTSRLLTSPGLVMGTVAYMSPEQARGQSVDARSDLWSLGVVLHEMLTGHSPFEGESVTELITSILKTDKTSVNDERVPTELKPICRKALTGDKTTRYQSADDLLRDLQGEKKRMEYAIGPRPYITTSAIDDLKTELIRRRPTLSAEYVVTTVKRHKYATVFVALLVLIGGIGLSVYKFNGATPGVSFNGVSLIDSSTTEKDLAFSRLPISSQTKEVVISPNGKYVAYLDLPAKGVKLLNTETSAQTELVATPAKGYYSSLSFSPDSKYIYYAHIPGGPAYGVMKVPVDGGSPVKVIDHSYSPVSFSPDGSTMVFTTEINDGDDGQMIMLANPDGSNQRSIAKVDGDNWVVNVPVWSPDGKTVAYQVGVGRAGRDGSHAKIIGINLADGRQQPLTDKKWLEIYGAVWLPNGNMVVSAKDLSSGSAATTPAKLWTISPGGETKAVTSGEVSYQGISTTRNGDTLVTQKTTFSNNLWLAPAQDPKKGVQITNSGELGGGFYWTPDGHIVMGSRVTGNNDLWIMDTDGNQRRQLTREAGLNVQPVVSPDGKTIVFSSDRINKVTHTFRMNIDGTDVRQLTNGNREIFPRISADGKWVYYIEVHNDKADTIGKVSINGGDPSTVISAPQGSEFTNLAIDKTDGRIAYGIKRRPNENEWKFEHKVGIMQANESTPKQLIDVPRNLFTSTLRWTPDGRSLAMLGGAEDVDRGAGSAVDIWMLPISGKGKPKAITDFRTPTTWNYTWSFDGRQLLYSRGTSNSEPFLIRTKAD